jgi:hypothetical protein
MFQFVYALEELSCELIVLAVPGIPDLDYRLLESRIGSLARVTV